MKKNETINYNDRIFDIQKNEFPKLLSVACTAYVHIKTSTYKVEYKLDNDISFQVFDDETVTRNELAKKVWEFIQTLK